MKLKLAIIALSLSASVSYAQKGVISENELNEIKSTFNQNDPSTKAIRNIIRSNKNIKSLALNSDVAGTINHDFKYKVTLNKTISDQHSSGRCWMFTSMNVLRPGVVKKFDLKSFDFSHNFSYFWDVFEKSNLFLENMITTADRDMDDRDVVEYLKSPVSDGGVWNHFINVAEKYGVVPQEVMPETNHSNATSAMMGVLKERLRKAGFDIREAAAAKKSTKEIEQIKMSALKDVYRVLALCLGEPPTSFDWEYTDSKGEKKVIKDYTPKKFFADIVPNNYNTENYIMIMNDPTRPYYNVYNIKNYRNTEEGMNWVYLNLPNEDIKIAALKSIKNDNPLYVSCDVGKDLNSTEGVMAVGMYDVASLFGIDLTMDKRARILTRQSASAHAMTLVACDTDDNDKPTKWQFENSWGPKSGHGGYLTFTDEWFDNYLFRIVVKKEYLDAKAIKALKGKTTELPAWDYMF